MQSSFLQGLETYLNWLANFQCHLKGFLSQQKRGFTKPLSSNIYSLPTTIPENRPLEKEIPALETTIFRGFCC